MRYQSNQTRRSGIVLITVLIVLAVLLLAGYQYLNLMTAENNAAIVSGRVTQSRYLADSGVHFASFVLAYPQTVGVSDGTETDSYRVWPGSVYDNSDVFHARPVNGPSGVKGYFSIISRRDPIGDPDASTIGYRFGVEDENGKINLNAVRQLIRKDPTQEAKIRTILLAIPNINEDIANAVINWSKEGGTPDAGESSYYSSLGYQSKGGPYDTIDELLLVKGWTPRLLYGNDKNRNGRLDPDEDDGSGQVDMGFQRYFTVYSRELNVDSTGQQRVNLKSTDLADLKSKLDAALGAEVADYLILSRVTKQQALPQSGASAILNGLRGNNRPKAVPEGVAIQQDKIVITDITKLQPDSSINYTTLWDFVDQYIAFSPPGNPNQPPTYLLSPFQKADKDKLRTALSTFFDKCSLEADYEIPARININSAPADVLSALGINQADIEKLLEYRPGPGTDPSQIPYYRTPAWLLTEADLSVDVLKLFSPYITTYSQVYRFQVVGYFELRGPQIRLEVVVDANNGRPRILHWRDLSDLGRGYNFSQTGPTFSP